MVWAQGLCGCGTPRTALAVPMTWANISAWRSLRALLMVGLATGASALTLGERASPTPKQHIKIGAQDIKRPKRAWQEA